MRERHDDTIWCVTQMNRVIQHGLTYQKACNLAALMQNGSDTHRAGSKTPQADFNVVKDVQAMQDHERLRRLSNPSVQIGV